MISTLFSNPIYFAISMLALILAIAIHEFSHAWTADRLGDPTPRLQGRLTLNPMAHLDLIGILFLMILGFGWGKPVTFDPYNLRNPRRDAAIISFAGPLSNLILASFFSILLRLFNSLDNNFLLAIGSYIFIPFITFNVVLAIFNMLPIHPLDGFKIVGGLLPAEKAREWYELERYGIIFLLLIIIPLGNRSMLDYLIRPVITFFLNIFIPSLGGGMGII